MLLIKTAEINNRLIVKVEKKIKDVCLGLVNLISSSCK
jgi:hypothetical protein